MPAASWPETSQKSVYMPGSSPERSSRARPPADRFSVRRSVFLTARLCSTVPSSVTRDRSVGRDLDVGGRERELGQ